MTTVQEYLQKRRLYRARRFLASPVLDDATARKWGLHEISRLLEMDQHKSGTLLRLISNDTPPETEPCKSPK